MSVKYVPPQTPLLYSKTGVCRGIPIFLIFAPKHRLWVPTIYVLSKNKKNINNFLLKIFNFYNLRKTFILHGHVFVMMEMVYAKFSCHEKTRFTTMHK